MIYLLLAGLIAVFAVLVFGGWLAVERYGRWLARPENRESRP